MPLKPLFRISFLMLLATGLSLAYSESSHAAQTCSYDNISSTAPAERFNDNKDGTVTDDATGLQWKRCSEGQNWTGSGCSGTASARGWQAALQLADSAVFAGHSDWRLPDLKELGTLVERACAQPAIDAATFPQTPSAGFWSSSPSAFGDDSRWLIRFENGYGIFAPGAAPYHVRLVRDAR